VMTVVEIPLLASACLVKGLIQALVRVTRLNTKIPLLASASVVRV
jgi:hypothetical protein